MSTSDEITLGQLNVIELCREDARWQSPYEIVGAAALRSGPGRFLSTTTCTPRHWRLESMSSATHRK